MTTGWFVLTRAIHIGACLLFFGWPAFDKFVAAPAHPTTSTEVARYWQSRLRQFNLGALLIILVSGAAWFGLVAQSMSGLSWAQALRPEVLQTVWSNTLFGATWRWRLIAWILAAVVVALQWLFRESRLTPRLLWIQLLLGGLLLGSLAWAGHGVEGHPARWHLMADVPHLLVAGFWPAGLLPLALLLRRGQQNADPAHWMFFGALVRRFSIMSLLAVALLVVTGWANSWFLVGSFSSLFRSNYGRWLVLKMIVFGIAVAIGAVNRTRLKPRLIQDGSGRQNADATIARLRRNVRWELLLGTAIILIVAILGMLPPAAR